MNDRWLEDILVHNGHVVVHGKGSLVFWQATNFLLILDRNI